LLEDDGADLTAEGYNPMPDTPSPTEHQDNDTRQTFSINHGIVKEHQAEPTVKTEPSHFTRISMNVRVAE